MYNKQAHSKWLCCTCLRTGKGLGGCRREGHYTTIVSHKLHFPSPKRSKTRWKEFIAKSRFFSWGPMQDVDAKVEFLTSIERLSKK